MIVHEGIRMRYQSREWLGWDLYQDVNGNVTEEEDRFVFHPFTGQSPVLCERPRNYHTYQIKGPIT